MLQSNHHIEGWKLNKLVKMYQLFEEQINKLIAGIVTIILASLATFFRNLPQYYIEAKQRRNFIKTQKLDITLDDVVEDTGAIYGHIIRYHDGDKELKAGNKWRMTIAWESVGKPCLSCNNTDCSFKTTRRKRLQREWDDVPVTSSWFKVVSRAYMDPGRCHLTAMDDPVLGEVERAIWKRSGIHCYIEMLIKIKGKKFFTLGLSFCERHKGLEECGDIIIAVNKLHKYL